MKQNITTLLLGIFLFFCNFFPSALASETELQIMTEKENIELGESFSLFLSVAHGNEDLQNLNIAHVKIPGLENFNLRSKSSNSQINFINGNMTVFSKTKNVLIPKEEGTFTIGPAFLQMPNGEKLQSNILSITVESPKEKEENTKILTENLRENGEKENSFFVWFLGGVILFAVAVLAFFSQSIFRNITKDHAPQNIPSQEYKQVQLPSIDTEDFFHQISILVRLFVDQHEKIETQGRTTTEIANALKQNYSENTELISEILFTCDLHQFAKKEGNREKVLEKVKELLEKT